jgi:hypothetical protein
MFSPEIARAAAALIFAAAAMPSSSLAQSDARSRIDELLDRIQAVESSEGENSAARKAAGRAARTA